MMYAFIAPESTENYLLWLLGGLFFAFITVLRFEYSAPERQPGLPFVLGVIIFLVICGYQAVMPFGPFEFGDQVVKSIMAAVGMVITAFLVVHFFRRPMMDYGLAPYYGDGIADSDDLRLLKYDLYGGHEDRVVEKLMQDAMARDQMNRFEKLSNMRQDLHEKEIMAGYDPSRKGDLYYQKYFLRKELEEILNHDVRFYK